MKITDAAVDYAFLQPEEKRSVHVMTANSTTQELLLPERGICVHQLFEAQVEQTPDAPALVVKGETLSYAQLNCRANQLAHRLELLGVGPEVLVGLCLPRTTDLLIALLAILKAGGAYVPLDPAYPPDRLRFQVDDAQVRLLITISSLEHLWEGTEVTRLYLDTAAAEDNAAPLSEDNLVCRVNEDNLAYVIYTSGSTGRPKGVCIMHRNTVALIRWGLDTYTLEDLQGVVFGTSICFDLSIFELFVPWSCGGAVHLVENGLHLPEREAREQITLLNMVPSVMAELVRTTSIPESVRVINFCGETLPRPLVERLYNLPGVQRIYNLYGPTEDTTYSTWSLLDRDEHSENVPIGWPLTGSQVYLLDPNGRPVADGEIGEIYLGGAGVARGYWNRPDMSAQRFVHDPFSQVPDARLYRTGDLARYRADGQLEFLGRSDQQVKIRGHRIELGEIENVLRQHIEVQEGVVLARKSAADNNLLLVAYVVSTRNDKEREDELRAFLQKRLPNYMIPNLFVFMEAFPKTSNGKINRQALPDPQIIKERKAPRSSQSKITNVLNLSTEKRKLFKKLLQKESPSSSSTPLPEIDTETKIETGEEPFPLAFPQQRYWLIDELDPGTSAYNIFFGFRIAGRLNVDAFTRSCHEIVRRHDTLRTAFFKVEGVPMQLICPYTDFPIPLYDLRAMSSEEQEQEENRILDRESVSSFDLANGVLIHVLIIQLADDAFTALINLHHIASDGWSMELFREELRSLYIAFSRGEASPLTDLPTRYVDYVNWQRKRLQGPLLEQQLAYWKDQLADLPAPLSLPADRPRPARQTFNGDVYCFELPPPLPAAIQDLAQSEGVTLFMILFAMFQILLCRLSGQDDILVGTPIAGRTLPGADQLIGCFVNSFVLRPSMKGDPSFRNLLQHIRTIALNAYKNHELPFEHILHEVRHERSTAYSHVPLFQVMFHYDFEKMNRNQNQRVKLNIEDLNKRNIAAKFDLSLRLQVNKEEDGDVIKGVFLYSTDLFDKDTIGRFAECFNCLAEAAIADPDQSIWRLSLLPQHERELLNTWNTTHLEAAPHEQALVYQLFEAQAAQTPGAAALVVQGETLSYAELNRKANQLAHHLRRLGVGPDALVGLCLPCTPDLIVALLAILKADGAYMPLALTYTPERLARILKETRATALITMQAQMSDDHITHQISLEADWSTIAQESMENPSPLVKGENRAYVLDTSNATEEIRGVVVEHRQLLSYTQAIAQRLDGVQGSSFAMVQPVTTDASVTAIYSTLCTGGTLHMIPLERASDAQWLSGYFQQYTIDCMCIEPAHLASLHRSTLVEPIMPSKCLILQGEPSSWEWVKTLKAEHPGCTILHQYGAPEVTVGAATYLVKYEQDEHYHVFTPIGRPLANTQMYILDPLLQPVPLQVAGELYIGGSTIARGYLYEPELMVEKFIADPFSADPEARLYKTGDLARYLPDGTIEFLGHMDDQIKIHSFQIKPSEVQFVLNRHLAVYTAVVTAREETQGNTKLVAYVMLQKGMTATVSDLRKHVSEYLPAHMIPSIFVFLNSMPMTAHGKIDYQALPSPDSVQEWTEHYTIPDNDIEARLLQMWESLLQISPISMQDNFFDLGGNSLLAVRLMALIQREFQQELPISVLFQKATPELLAAELLRRRWSNTRSALVEIQPTGTKRPFFCVHPIGGEVFCYADLARQLGPEQPFYGLQFVEQSHQEAFQTIEEMARTYILEVQSVQPNGPYVLGGWSVGGVIAFEMSRQLVQQGQEVAFLALFDSFIPIARSENAKSLVQMFGNELEGVFNKKLSIDYTQLSDLVLEEQLMHFYARAQMDDVLPPDLEFAALRGMFLTYRSVFAAWHEYQPQSYTGKITLFSSKSRESNKRILQWQALTPQEVEQHTLSGGHYSLLKKPHLNTLVEQMQCCLNEIE